MRLNSSLGYLVAAWSLVGATAAAESFRARLSYIPPQAGTDCDAYALQLGDRFGLSYAVRVIESICDPNQFERNSWSIVISYEAEQELGMVATIDRFKPLSEQATYKSEGECQLALANEIGIFESRTGLKSFISYCAAPAYENDGWALQIVGFGSSTIKAFVVSTPYFGKIIDMTRADFDQMLRHGFLSNGAELAHWQVSPKLGYGMLSVRYYGSEKLPFQGMELAKMRSSEECTAQIEDLRTGLANYNSAGYASYCHQVFGMGQEFELVWLTGSESQHRIAQASAEYRDFASCMAAKSAVVERYRTELRRDIVAGICGLSEGRKSYRVQLLEKPRS